MQGSLIGILKGYWEIRRDQSSLLEGPDNMPDKARGFGFFSKNIFHEGCAMTDTAICAIILLQCIEKIRVPVPNNLPKS